MAHLREKSTAAHLKVSWQREDFARKTEKTYLIWKGFYCTCSIICASHSSSVRIC